MYLIKLYFPLIDFISSKIHTDEHWWTKNEWKNS